MRRVSPVSPMHIAAFAALLAVASAAVPNARLAREQPAAEIRQDAAAKPTRAAAPKAACTPEDDCIGCPINPVLPSPAALSSDSQHVLAFELAVREATVCVSRGKWLHTRTLGGTVPGPTVRVKPGQRLVATVTNMLTADGVGHEENKLSAAQETNVHLHGLHIDGDWPSDSIVRVLMPGDSAAYTAAVPSDHMPGTHWIHPHRHGSTTLQVMGGAAAAVIVEEKRWDTDAGAWVDAAPAPVAGAPEHLLVFQPVFDWVRINGLYNDNLFQTNLKDGVTLVNGVMHPVINVAVGVWTRLRIINTSWSINDFDFKVDGCAMALLAKDGVYIKDFPRYIKRAPVPPGGRADIMVRCDASGSYDVIGYTKKNNDGTCYVDCVAATVHAAGAAPVPQPTLAPFTLESLPAYLADTREADVTGCSCKTGPSRKDGLLGINGRPFSTAEYVHTAVLGRVQERVLSFKDHPYHQHVIPFQLHEISADSVEDAVFFRPGDWHDVWNGDGKVRYNPSRFAGKMVLHCHRLEHEDKGMMATELMLRTGSCKCDWSSVSCWSVPLIGQVCGPDGRNKLIAFVVLIIVLVVLVYIFREKLRELVSRLLRAGSSAISRATSGDETRRLVPSE